MVGAGRAARRGGWPLMGAGPGARRRRHGRLSTSTLLALLAVAFLALLLPLIGPHGPVAAASVTTTAAPQTADNLWSVVPTPTPYPHDNSLNGVSCVSATFCMAVGTGIGSDGLSHPYAEEWDGTSWDLVNGPQGFLDSVSCTSPTFCMGVGLTNTPADNDSEQPYAAVWGGRTWTTQPAVNPPETPDVYREVGFNGVSCPSSSSCVAVGFYQVNGNSGSHLLAERWDAGAWSMSQPVDPGYWNSFADVSCSDQGGQVCMAVGVFSDKPATCESCTRPGHAIVETSTDGSSWSVDETVDAVASNTSAFSGVSCSSATQCEAVGDYTIANSGADFLLSGSWSGQGWVLAHNPPGLGPGRAVSCLGATDCIDVATTDKANGWDGSTWAPFPIATEPNADLVSLSCVPGFCVTVGNVVQQTLTEQGCAWVPGATDGPAPAATGASPRAGLSTGDLAGRGPTRAASAKVANPCTLSVSFRVISPLKTGLSFLTVNSAAGADPDQLSTAGFFRTFEQNDDTGLAGDGLRKNGCVSGCVDVVVTVKNSSHKPVQGAKVNASVTAMTHAVGGQGFICGQYAGGSDGYPSPVCGAVPYRDVNGLRTNADGQVLLRYWAPAITRRQTVLLTAKATTEPGCAGTKCTLAAEGESTVPLNLQPDAQVPGPETKLIGQAVLSRQDAEAIAAWANPADALQILRDDPRTTLGSLLGNYLTTQGATSNQTDKVGVLKWARLVSSYYDLQKGVKKEETDALLLLLLPLGVQALGLGETSRSANFEPDLPSDQLNPSFLSVMASPSIENLAQRWIDNLPLPLPVNLSPVGVPWDHKAGVLWSFGRFENKVHADSDDWEVQLQLIDVSYCDQAKQVADPEHACGPGSKAEDFNLPVGLQPYMYIQLTLAAVGQNRKPDTVWTGHVKNVLPGKEFTARLIVPYNPTAWMKAQFAPS